MEFSNGFTGGVGTAGVGGLGSFTFTFSGVGLAFISGLGVGVGDGLATPGLMILPDSLLVPGGCCGCPVPFRGPVGLLRFTGMGGAGNASLGSSAPGCDCPSALIGILMISIGFGRWGLGGVGATGFGCPVPDGNRAVMGSGTVTGLDTTPGVVPGVLVVIGP